MKCKNCGAKLDNESSFCQKCGYPAPTQHEIKMAKITRIAVTIILIMLVVGIVLNYLDRHPKKQSTNQTTTITKISLNDCYDTLLSQKRAIDDIIGRYSNSEQTAGETIEDLNGLVFGIENTIDFIAKNPDSQQRSDLDQIAWCLRGYAKHYSDYLSDGNSRDLEDSQNLKESYDKYLDTYNQTY